MKTIVITGSSSGIGKATAKYFAEKGWNVAATMRTPDKETELTGHNKIKLYTLDVTNEDSVDKATGEILNDFNTVDVVLNNAGYALMGPFEATSLQEVKSQFDTNVFGLMNVTRAFLPHFRENGSGLFMNVSSIGGLITFPLMSLYHSTKWAVEGFSESVAYELGQLGIQIKIIEPGGVATDFGGRSMTYASKDNLTAYDETISTFRKNISSAGIQSSTPEFLAQGIYNAATDGKIQLRYVIGPDAENFYSTRRKDGDENFISGMRNKIFGEIRK